MALGTDEVMAVFDAVSDRYRALVVFVAGTGVRQGEAFGLTIPHLDMLRRVVHIEQQLVLVPGRPPFLAPPKTATSHRTVDPSMMVPGAIVVAGDPESPAVVEVVDVVDKPAGTIVHLRLLPGTVEDCAALVRRTFVTTRAFRHRVPQQSSVASDCPLLSAGPAACTRPDRP